jgi:DNA-binding IscR family transcriptional regulator
MRKLLNQLERSGLVTAAEGVRRGLRLSRTPAGISVLEVVDAAQRRLHPRL